MITLWENDNVNLRLDLDNELPLLHFNINKWSVQIYKDLLDKWTLVLEMLKDSGIPVVYSCIASDDTKTQKFQNMFGLEKFLENEEAVLYKLEIK